MAFTFSISFLETKKGQPLLASNLFQNITLLPKLREIANMRSKGKPVLNLGIGSPDLHVAYVSHISHIVSFALAGFGNLVLARVLLRAKAR